MNTTKDKGRDDSRPLSRDYVPCHICGAYHHYLSEDMDLDDDYIVQLWICSKCKGKLPGVEVGPVPVKVKTQPITGQMILF